MQQASSCFIAGYRVDHNIKGQGIYAYVVLAEGTKPSAELKKKLDDVAKNQVGSSAVPTYPHHPLGLQVSEVRLSCSMYIHIRRHRVQIPCRDTHMSKETLSRGVMYERRQYEQQAFTQPFTQCIAREAQSYLALFCKHCRAVAE